MPKYLFRASCRGEGPSNDKDVGPQRRTSLEQALAAVAGKLESFAYAFGDMDVIAIAELPDDVSATAFVSGVSAGGVVEIKHTVLITPWGPVP